jgi:hypothetical protein
MNKNRKCNENGFSNKKQADSISRQNLWKPLLKLIKYKPAGSRDQENVSREKWVRGQSSPEVTQFFDC